MVKCEINFDNKGTFFAGKNLSGSVALELVQEKEVRSLRLIIEGFARCSFSRNQGAEFFSGHEEFINHTIYLFGNETGRIRLMPAGHSSYKFSCFLPETLPSSIEAKQGKIYYGCKVVFDRPVKPDVEFQQPFTVVKTKDLNLLSPSLAMPVQMKIVRFFYTMCFTSRPLVMAARIPCSGLVPGQTVNIAVKINNMSGQEVDLLKVSIDRNTDYQSKIPFKESHFEIEEVAKVYGPPIKGREAKEYKIPLVVPHLPPASLASCKVLSYTYQLQISAIMKGNHEDPVITFPITIGTNPLNIPKEASNYSISVATTSTTPTSNYDDVLKVIVREDEFQSVRAARPKY